MTRSPPARYSLRHIRHRARAHRHRAVLGIFIGEGTSTYVWGGAIAIRPIGGPNARWQMTIYGTGTVTVKEYGFLTKDELDTEFAHWHSQMRGWINGFLKPAQGSG